MNILKTLARNIYNYSNPKSIANKFRAKRIEKVKFLISKISLKKKEVLILDIGGTKLYWDLFAREFLQMVGAKVTLLNIDKSFEKDDEIFSYVEGDGCNLIQYANNQFDVVVSNSTIEHVGNWEKRKLFAQEVRRLAPVYYVQTPNFWFPVEPHCFSLFFHWMPENCQAELHLKKSLGFYRKEKDIGEAIEFVEGKKLLTKEQMSFLFPDGCVCMEKVLFLNKSIVIYRS